MNFQYALNSLACFKFLELFIYAYMCILIRVAIVVDLDLTWNVGWSDQCNTFSVVLSELAFTLFCIKAYQIHMVN
jgi:hypothetical protein